MNGSKSLLAMVLAAAVVGLGGMGLAADVTWDGSTDMSWTQPDATSWGADTYNSGDNVLFAGAGQGTIAVDAGGVSPGVATVSAGTYLISGGNVNASSWTVSGGELQWDNSDRLGTGPINVTGNAILRSTKTTGSPVARLANSAINISNGVTLDIYHQGPNNNDPTGPMVPPIHGGALLNPITLNLFHTVSQGRVELSASDFIGDVYLRSRSIYRNLNDNQFGDSSNRLYIVGGLETYASNVSINRPVTIQGGYLGGPGGGPIIFDGVVTNTGAPSIVGAIRFNNAASTLGGLYPNGGTVEFGHLPTGGSSRSDGGGGNGVTFRFLGDLVGNASFGISKNYDFSDGVAANRWLYIDVPSAAADVTLTQAVSGYQAGRGGFRKDGAGTLTLNANGGNIGAFQVRGGRLNVNSTLSGVTDMTVANLATLAINGTVNGTAPTVAVAVGGTLTGTGTFNGAATVAGTLTGRVAITGNTTVTGVHAPGHSPGLQNVGSYTLDGGTLEIEIEGATAGNGAGFHDQVNVTGTVTLSNNPTLTIVSASGLVVGDVLTIIANDSADPVVGTFAGLAEGALFTAFGEKLAISYVGGSGNDVTLTRIPEPTSLALLALAGLVALRRR